MLTFEFKCEGVAGTFVQQVNIMAFAWLVLICETHVERSAIRGVFIFYLHGTLLKRRNKMILDFEFFLTSLALGVGLAMDAFSVSLANGLNEPCMKKTRMSMVASVFALFQFAMPLIGWLCVSTVAGFFKAFEKFIPWIALALLSFIGGKMIYEGITKKCVEEECSSVSLKLLFLQGVATSIDALSVGFTIADYSPLKAATSCLVIGAVTFVICFCGIAIGKTAGTKLADKAGILGGAILVFIGLEIFITNVF